MRLINLAYIYMCVCEVEWEFDPMEIRSRPTHPRVSQDFSTRVSSSSSSSYITLALVGWWWWENRHLREVSRLEKVAFAVGFPPARGESQDNREERARNVPRGYCVTVLTLVRATLVFTMVAGAVLYIYAGKVELVKKPDGGLVYSKRDEDRSRKVCNCCYKGINWM